jgi:ankyrin repeat protein
MAEQAQSLRQQMRVHSPKRTWILILVTIGCMVLAGVGYVAIRASLDLALVNVASDGRDSDVMKWLSRGSDVNARDNGRTALMYAVQELNLGTARALLNEGADPNLVDDNGTTALMIAADRNKPELVRLLLAHGARPNAVDDSGKSARDYAELDKSTDVLPLLPPSGRRK